MADGVVPVNPSTELTAVDIDNTAFGSTTFRQRIVIGGDASSGSLIDPNTTAPSSAVFALPVRLAMNSTDNVIGNVVVSNTVDVSLLTSPISIQTNGGNPASLPATVYSSSASALNVFLSTGQNTSGIDPRIVTPSSQFTVTAALAAGSTASVAPTSQWTVTAALAAASTISVAPTSQWTVTAALAAGSTVSVAPTSQWTVTAALAAASTISVAPTTQWTVTVLGGASSGVAGTNLISTGLTGAAIDPRQATIVAATSGTGLGVIISTGAGAAAIDPRQISAGSTLDVRVIGAGSSSIIGTILMATGLGGSAIDPRGTLTASSSQTFPIQMSTAPDGAYIDPRIVTPSSQWTVTAQTGASTNFLGLIAVSTSTGTGAPIDPRQVTVVAGTSGLGLGTIISTGAGGAAIDPRQISAGSTLDVRVIGAGSSGVSGTHLISTGLTGAAIDPRILSTSGAVVVRDKYGIGANRRRRAFYMGDTGVLATTGHVLINFHQVDGLSSGSSGNTFTVGGGADFHLTWINAALWSSTANSARGYFAIRADGSATATTATDTPVWYGTILSTISGATTILGQGDGQINAHGMDIVLPSDASFGVTVAADSSVSRNAYFAFGGYESTG